MGGGANAGARPGGGMPGGGMPGMPPGGIPPHLQNMMAGMNPQMMNQMMQRFGGMGLGGGQ